MTVAIASIAELLHLPPGSVPNREEERRAAGILAERLLARDGKHFHRDEKLLPVWPEGFSGSVSHCRGEVAVAVRRGAPLGIDLEEIGRVGEKLFARIAAPEEVTAYRARSRNPDADELFRTVVFSAKEAFWKLLRNSGGGNPGWREVAAEFTLESPELTVRGAGLTASGNFKVTSGNRIMVILEIGK